MQEHDRAQLKLSNFLSLLYSCHELKESRIKTTGLDQLDEVSV